MQGPRCNASELQVNLKPQGLMIGPLRRCIYLNGPDAIREIWADESIINTSVSHLFEFCMTCVRIPTA